MGISKQVYEINMKDIKVSSSNTRSTDRKVGLEDLVRSIERYGLLQPVVLRGSYGNPPYELVVGRRRFLAHQELGRDTIKAVFSGDLQNIEANMLSLAENMHRVELNYADKAKAITALYLHHNRNAQRVAQELGLSPQTVREYVRIEELATPKAKKLLRESKITRQDVKRSIDAAQGDPEKADSLLDEMIKLSKYEKDRAVKYGRSHPEASADEIIEESKKPRLESTIILNLTPEIDEALNGRAKRRLLMDKELIATKALSEWLRDKGFLKPKAQEVMERR